MTEGRSNTDDTVDNLERGDDVEEDDEADDKVSIHKDCRPCVEIGFQERLSDVTVVL